MEDSEIYDLLLHELNTPLTVIKGYTELVQEHITDPKTSEYLNLVMRNIERLEELPATIADKMEKKKIKYQIASD